MLLRRLKRTMIASACILLVAIMVTGLRFQTVYPAIDSYAWQLVPEANNGSSNNFQITSASDSPRNMRGFIKFNLPQIPQRSILIWVDLKLRVWSKSPNDPSRNLGDPTGRSYGIFRLVGGWKEFEVNWANQPSYTEDGYSVAVVPSGEGGWFPEDRPLWMRWRVTEIVSKWNSGTVENHGFLVRDLEEDSPILYATQFFTHDNVPSTNYFPILELVYFVWPFSS